METTNLCVLIDFENIAAGAEKEGLGRFKLEYVLRRLKDKGRILVARAYGDWGRFAKFKQDLLRMGVQLMELTSFRGQEKNRADIALVVDAMEFAYTRSHFDTFVILSGDSDFTPLIMRLKELNKRVLGVGTRRSTSALLKDACDEFIFYDNLVREQSDIYPVVAAVKEPPIREPAPPELDDEDMGTAEEPARSLSKDEAFALMVETIKGLMHDSPGPVSAGLVKASILRKEPAFNELEYGYSGFTRMLEAAQERSLLTLHRDERAGGVRVEVSSEPVPPPPVAHEPEEEDMGDLPALTGEAGRLRDILGNLGIDPLPRVYRHTVVYEFADHVADRMNKKKRNTFIYTVGDIARRCRDTVPPVPPRHVRSVLNALAQTGELLHPDGKPARTPTAPFIIRKDGEGLLDALSGFYLRVLADRGETLDDSVALSQLLYGDDEHVQIVEEMVAWMQHERASGGAEARGEAEASRPERSERRDDRGDRGDRGERRDGRDRRGRDRDRRGRDRDRRRDDRPATSDAPSSFDAPSASEPLSMSELTDVRAADEITAEIPPELEQAAPAEAPVTVEPPGAGTPGAGTPAAGTPGAGTPAAGTPAEQSTPAAGTPAAGTPAAGTPAVGTPAEASAEPAADAEPRRTRSRRRTRKPKAEGAEGNEGGDSGEGSAS